MAQIDQTSENDWEDYTWDEGAQSYVMTDSGKYRYGLRFSDRCCDCPGPAHPIGMCDCDCHAPDETGQVGRI